MGLWYPGHSIKRKYAAPLALRYQCMVRIQDNTDACWEWKRRLQPGRYAPGFLFHYRKVLAHRWIYEYLVGPIPEGFIIFRLCRNRHCVNPWHLEPKTLRWTQRRAAALPEDHEDLSMRMPPGPPDDRRRRARSILLSRPGASDFVQEVV